MLPSPSRYGEEKQARQVARAIVDARYSFGRITTTKQLADVVAAAIQGSVLAIAIIAIASTVVLWPTLLLQGSVLAIVIIAIASTVVLWPTLLSQGYVLMTTIAIIASTGVL